MSVFSIYREKRKQFLTDFDVNSRLRAALEYLAHVFSGAPYHRPGAFSDRAQNVLQGPFNDSCITRFTIVALKKGVRSPSTSLNASASYENFATVLVVADTG